MPDSISPEQRKRLSELLKRHERSQAWLARQLRMNESLLSHTVAGRRRVPRDFWSRVAEILGVRPEELLAGDRAA